MLFDKLVGDLIDDDRTRRCGTTLAGRPERALRGRFDGEIHVAVLEHDDRIFPAHLRLHRNAAGGRLLVKLDADLVRAGKGNCTYGRMIDDLVAGLPA